MYELTIYISILVISHKIHSPRVSIYFNHILLSDAGCRRYERTADKGTPTFIERPVCYFPQRWERYEKIGGTRLNNLYVSCTPVVYHFR